MSKTVEVKKEWKDMSMIEKIICFVKGGDAANVAAILKVTAKKWEKQIKLKRRAIEELKEKLAETLDEQKDYKADELEIYEESFLNVDVTVKGRDAIGEYVDYTYEQQISDAKEALDARDKVIANHKEVTAKAIERLEKSIATYEEFLSKIK